MKDTMLSPWSDAKTGLNQHSLSHISFSQMADDKCGHLEGLIKRKETALKQTKLILRFRDEGLKKLEKARKSNTEEEQANDIVVSLCIVFAATFGQEKLEGYAMFITMGWFY